MTLRQACLGTVLLSLMAAAPARAQTVRAGDLSDYEQETVDAALDHHKFERDPAPEGKKIVDVLFDVLDVFEDRDPAPNFLNIFHANSKPYTIERELLFRRGDAYDATLVEESARNIRDLRQVSLVLVVPIKTKDPKTVKVLYVTKDVWSLRLNSNYRLRSGGLEFLLLQPAEENFGGTHRRAAVEFLYEPDTIALGAQYLEPRIDGSRVRAAIDVNMLINHGSGALEGTFGFFSVGQPLYSTRTRWAWGSSVAWRKEVTRRFVGVELDTFDSDLTAADDRLPFVYNTEIIGGAFSVQRSFGTALKHDVQFGIEAERRAFRTPSFNGWDSTAIADFRQSILPFSETRTGPYFQYQFYVNDFGSLVDVETIGLQENYRFGPKVQFRVYPRSQLFASTRNFIGHALAASTTHQLGDGLIRLYGAAEIESSYDFGTVYDALFRGGFRLVTPKFAKGRLIFDTTFGYRPENFSNSVFTVGGDSRLRGYGSAQFRGANLFASNLEYRSPTIPLWTVLLRGALFVDVADAPDTLEEFRPKQSAGFGLRLLFPQLGRSVMRVDWGFPLTTEDAPPSLLDGLVFTFSQAYGVPRLANAGVSTAP